MCYITVNKSTTSYAISDCFNFHVLCGINCIKKLDSVSEILHSADKEYGVNMLQN